MKCPVCTNLTGFPGAKKCEEADIVTCEPAGVMDRCLTMNAVMSFSGVATIPFQLKNCSNSLICDPNNNLNSKYKRSELLDPTASHGSISDSLEILDRGAGIEVIG